MATNDKEFKVKNNLHVGSGVAAANQGGQIDLAVPTSGTTLAGSSVTLDVYQNKLRIFEDGGTNRGAYIDLTAATASVGTNLLSGGGGISYDAQALSGTPTVTLTSSSARVWNFTGTATSAIVKLPVVSTLSLGDTFRITNNPDFLSLPDITVQSSGSDPIVVLSPGQSAVFIVKSITGTLSDSWTYSVSSAYKTGSGAAVYGDNPTISLPSINNLILGYSTRSTASTTLVNSSNYQQYFTGSTAQTVTLPVASTMTLGGKFLFVNNNSANALTINSSGGNLVASVPIGGTAEVTCILASGTTAASWSVAFNGYASLRAPAADPTFTGTVTAALLDLTTAATATAATSYFVETGSDGIVRPKTLANVKTELIGNAFTAFSGPATSTKTFTLPNATATILTDNAAVTLTQGGTNASLTASNGGIVYSTATAMAILAGTATAGQVLRSGASGAPSWSAYTLPTSVTANQALYASSTTVVTAGTLPVAAGGTNASSAGITAFNNITGYTASGATGTTSTNIVFSTSPTITTPTIDTINTSLTTTGTAALFNTGITTGTISIGGALTTGTINIGSGTAGAKTINIGTSTGSTTLNGTINVATLDLTTAATATTATSYFIETGSDGIVRPKTLANVRTEVVTTAAVNSAAATTVGTVTSGTWNATTIATSRGGTGLTTIGTASQVLKVNSGATALEWGTIAGAVYQTTAPTSPQVGDIWVDSDASASVLNTNDYLLKADAIVTYSNLNTNQPSFRNVLINGGFAIDQRNNGASQTITAGAANAYTVDRWAASCTGANVTGARVAGAAPSRYYYRFTGATSNTGVFFSQRIEIANSYHLAGRTVTLSVKLASTSLTSISWAAGYANAADDFTGISGFAGGTFTISPTLTTYTATFTVSASATTGLRILFSAGALVASQTLTFADAQLELGSIATPFEQRSIGMELASCQRYYYRSQMFGTTTFTMGNGHVQSSSIVRIIIPCPVTLRLYGTTTLPSITSSTASNFTVAGGGSAGNAQVATAIGIAAGNPPSINGQAVDFTTAATSGTGPAVCYATVQNSFIAIDAEL